MHSPMQSLGESSTQPSTPCSASGECGGSRSTRASVVASFRLRVRFKSGGPPALSAMESIIASIEPDSRMRCYGKLLDVLRTLFTMRSRRCETKRLYTNYTNSHEGEERRGVESRISSQENEELGFSSSCQFVQFA